MIQEVIYRREYSLRDTVLRILLFKIFNKIETWEFDQLLPRALEGGASIYSAAYIMPSGPASIRQPRKHRMHLELLADLLRKGLPEDIVAAKSMAELYGKLVSLPSFGAFLAYPVRDRLELQPPFRTL